MERIKKEVLPGKSDSSKTSLNNYLNTLCPTTIREARLAFFDVSEGFQVALSEAISYNYTAQRLQQQDTLAVLKWLCELIQSVNAFCFAEGNSTRHLIPEDFCRYIEDFTARFQTKYGGSADFQQFWQHPNVVHLNKLRWQSRSVELAFLSWKSVLSQWKTVSAETQARIAYQGKILNRLSSYFWICTQRERTLLGLEAQVWTGCAPEFDKAYFDRLTDRIEETHDQTRQLD